MEREAKKGFIISFFYYMVITVIIAVVCRFMLKYLLPFILAGVIAYFMQRPAEFLSKYIKIKSNKLAALLSALFYFSAVSLLGFIVYRLGYLLAGALESFLKYLPKLTSAFESLQHSKYFENLPIDVTKFFQNSFNDLVSALTALISKWLSTGLSGMPSFFLSCVVALIASCYIAKDYKGLFKFFKDLCGQRVYGNISKIAEILKTGVFKMIKGYVILSAITFFVVLAGLLLLRVKYAFLLAGIVAVVDVLPVLGAGCVLVPWAIFEIVFKNFNFGIAIAVLYLITVFVRNFAEPKIIGKQIGINPLFTLLAMFVGLKLFGAAGVIIVPVALLVIIKYYKEEDILSE